MVAWWGGEVLCGGEAERGREGRDGEVVQVRVRAAGVAFVGGLLGVRDLEGGERGGGATYVHCLW